MKTTQQQTARASVKDRRQQEAVWRSLAARLDSRRQIERRRLARIIQDELGQNLASLKMELWSLQQDFAQEHPLWARTADLLKLANESVETANRISAELHPAILTHLGLVAALEWQSAAFEEETGIRCRFIPAARMLRLSRARGAALFQIVQECLAYASTGSRPEEITVHLNRRPGKLVLLVISRKKRGARNVPSTRKVSHLIPERVRLLGGTVAIKRGAGLTIRAVIPFRGSKGKTG